MAKDFRDIGARWFGPGHLLFHVGGCCMRSLASGMSAMPQPASPAAHP